MSKKFIKHGNSTIKISSITGVSWKPEWTKYGGAITRNRGRYVGIGSKSYCAKVTIESDAQPAIVYYDSDELAEEAHDEIVAKCENA